MIIVKLIGGLGNQMFQYACGRNLALQKRVDLKLDISAFRTYTRHKYGLDNFNISPHIATNEETHEIEALAKRGEFGYAYVVEPHFHYFSGIKEVPEQAILDGYWQSEKYFHPSEKKIHEDFSVKVKLEGINLELSNRIMAVDSVALHIRRGDYIWDSSANHVHGVPTWDYYQQCIEFVSGHIDKPVFFIFSDDPDWVDENIQIDFPHTIVRHNDASQNYEDLRLMSACKHQIIANSTFSWWAAWLNTNPNKIVCAPKIWFANSPHETKDLYPTAWYKF